MQDTLITVTIVTFGFLLVANVFFRIKKSNPPKAIAQPPKYKAANASNILMAIPFLKAEDLANSFHCKLRNFLTIVCFLDWVDM